MTANLLDLRRICENRIGDVRDRGGDMTDVLNVGTVLFLTASKLRDLVADAQVSSPGGALSASQALDHSARDLQWVRDHVHASSGEEVRARVLNAGDRVLGVLDWLLAGSPDGHGPSPP